MAERKLSDAIMANLSAKWSPDLDRFLAGEIGVTDMRCALCTHSPCDCPPFGSDEYFALINERHSK